MERCTVDVALKKFLDQEITTESLEEFISEVRIMKRVRRPNVVLFMGAVTRAPHLSIVTEFLPSLLEFVPEGSISSLLGKFGHFHEAVIRMYTKQLLLGLDYLHKNGIMHRDIKGVNILVDNKGCIKLADLVHQNKLLNCSADIWSVGCTVIEMATGKPPWSQQYQQEVIALFYIGTTKSHPPIPDHLSIEAQDLLLKWEPEMRPSASRLLQVFLYLNLKI
ncbi:hypothetical protein L1887_44407 [Cichorium endivia]|nr:hypothetical protein L1887_44407 [Cichorium endivia]